MYDPTTLIRQIGMSNIYAISGGRIRHATTFDGIILPIRYGYTVEVEYCPNDTYTVRRVWSKNGAATVKGVATDVYADQVSDTAYRASCYKDPM